MTGKGSQIEDFRYHARNIMVHDMDIVAEGNRIGGLSCFHGFLHCRRKVGIGDEI